MHFFKKIEVVSKRKSDNRFIEMTPIERIVIQKVKKGLKHKVKICVERGTPWKIPRDIEKWLLM